MPASLAHPVLALAMQNFNQFNTIDADNLGCMWTVFTKCKENLENGRRLENISWRLWYRETMLLDRPYEKLKVSSIGSSEPQPTKQPVVECAPISSPSDLMGNNNGLNCVDNASAADGDCHQSPPTTTIPAAGTSQEVESSSPKSFMKHLSPLSFQRIISSLVPAGADSSDWKSIKEAKVVEQTSHSAPQAVAPVVVSASEAGHATNSYPRSFIREQHQEPLDQTNAFTVHTAYTPLSQLTYGEAHETSIASSSSSRARSVVKGFVTSNVERAQPKSPQPQNTKGKFFIDNEDSESDDDDDDDMETPTNNAFAHKLRMDSLPHTSGLRYSRPFPPSFVENEEEEEEEDDVVTNAEDNESDLGWDDAAESRNLSPPEDDGIFKKTSVSSQREQQLLHLVPRRSLLSSLLAQKPQPQAFLRSSRSVYQDLHTLSTSLSADATPQPVPVISRKTAADQALRQQYVAPIHSPATIRRDILCSELSESLRRNLLRERQQTNLPYAAATSKARNSVNALRGRYAEPQVALNTVSASTALGGDKNLGWFESFRGW